MKKHILACFVMILLVLTVCNVHAELITIGTATYNGSVYNLIWDGNNNGRSVVWLDYSADNATFADQTAWAGRLSATLTNLHTPGYNVTWNGGWRLPGVVDGLVGDLGHDGQTTAGYNITSSEMGHLYYTELGNKGAKTKEGIRLGSGFGLIETGAFKNVSSGLYLSGTAGLADPDYAGSAWYHQTQLGYQDIMDINQGLSAIALRTADVSELSAVPVPGAIWLLGTGLSSLALSRRLWRN